METANRKLINRLLQLEQETIVTELEAVYRQIRANDNIVTEETNDKLKDIYPRLDLVRDTITKFGATRPKLQTYTYLTGDIVEIEAHSLEEAERKLADMDYDTIEAQSLLQSIN